MAFADETAYYVNRHLVCGWGARAQSAIEMAARAQKFAQRLGAVDAAYERLRPDPGLRTYRPGDRGPIVEIETTVLADLIDRRGRFDLPPYPAPVGPHGYHVLYRSDHAKRHPSALSVSISAGQYGDGRAENQVEVSPELDHEIWRHPDLALQVFDAMADIWAPEWACAYAFMGEYPVPGEQPSKPRTRPWLAWTAKPMQPRPVPPFNRPFAYPFPLDQAGPPAEVSQWRGGELQFWP
jgi:hypothetical protein